MTWQTIQLTNYNLNGDLNKRPFSYLTSFRPFEHRLVRYSDPDCNFNFSVPSTSGLKRPRKAASKYVVMSDSDVSDKGDSDFDESDSDGDEFYSTSSKKKRQRQNQVWLRWRGRVLISLRQLPRPLVLNIAATDSYVGNLCDEWNHQVARTYCEVAY